MQTTRPQQDNDLDNHPDSIIRRSWHAMADLLSPFSSSALASLPVAERPVRYTRADAIPDTAQNDGHRPTLRDYHAITSLPGQVRVPKKIATSVKVEGKVWFANERSESCFEFVECGARSMLVLTLAGM